MLKNRALVNRQGKMYKRFIVKEFSHMLFYLNFKITVMVIFFFLIEEETEAQNG